MGVIRHTLTKEELLSIYKDIDNLQADLTREEYEQYRDAFVQIKTLIHSIILMG